MIHEHGLALGAVLTNRQLMDVFKCGVSGGMRRSRATNSLIIISDPTKATYEDRWEGEVFHYTGMGLEGDQSLDYAQNKTLARSSELGIDLFLFEVQIKIYRGVCSLVSPSPAMSI